MNIVKETDVFLGVIEMYARLIIPPLPFLELLDYVLFYYNPVSSLPIYNASRDLGLVTD